MWSQYMNINGFLLETYINMEYKLRILEGKSLKNIA